MRPPLPVVYGHLLLLLLAGLVAYGAGGFAGRLAACLALAAALMLDVFIKAGLADGFYMFHFAFLRNIRLFFLLYYIFFSKAIINFTRYDFYVGLSAVSFPNKKTRSITRNPASENI